MNITYIFTARPIGPGGGNGDAVNVGAIVGGIIGGLLLIAGIVVLTLFLYWRYEPKEDNKEIESRVSVCLLLYYAFCYIRYFSRA